GRHALRSFPTRRSSDLKACRAASATEVDWASGDGWLLSSRASSNSWSRVSCNRTAPCSAQATESWTSWVSLPLESAIRATWRWRSEEHTSELQSRENLV